jgi:hypothetical protein
MEPAEPIRYRIPKDELATAIILPRPGSGVLPAAPWSGMVIDIRTLTLWNNEEAGDSHLAVYVYANGQLVLRWNNGGRKVNEISTFELGERLVWVPPREVWLTVHAYTHDDDEWPSDTNYENAFSASHFFVPSSPETFGAVSLVAYTGWDTNISLHVLAGVMPATPPTQVFLALNRVDVIDDEESGGTHMALYVYASYPGQNNQEILRWNNGNAIVSEPFSYDLAIGGSVSPPIYQLALPLAIRIEAYTDDDLHWPSQGNNENNLGAATFVVDPLNPATLGQFSMGPTTTDGGRQGIQVYGAAWS